MDLSASGIISKKKPNTRPDFGFFQIVFPSVTSDPLAYFASDRFLFTSCASKYHIYFLKVSDVRYASQLLMPLVFHLAHANPFL